MNWEQKYDALASMIEGYRHERDEALERVRLLEAEVERVNAREDATRRELAETRIDMRDAQRERDEAQKEAARLKRWIYRTRKESLENKGEEITDDPASLLHSMFYEIVDGRVDRLDSFRRGAEAMREACLRDMDRFIDAGSPYPGVMAHSISALPIPEEP